MSDQENRSKMSREEAGRLGGIKRAEKYSHEQLSQQAKRGAETIEKVRPGFHQQIGQKGGKAGGSKGGHAGGGHNDEE